MRAVSTRHLSSARIRAHHLLLRCLLTLPPLSLKRWSLQWCRHHHHHHRLSGLLHALPAPPAIGYLQSRGLATTYSPLSGQKLLPALSNRSLGRWGRLCVGAVELPRAAAIAASLWFLRPPPHNYVLTTALVSIGAYLHAHMHATLAGALVVQRRPQCTAYPAGADPHEVARIRDVDPLVCEGTINCT